MNNDGSPHLGAGRIAIAVVLSITAVGLLIGALFPGQAGVPGDAVSLPDFFLAVGASAAVAAIFFFLSAQIKRAEVRTDEAIGELREEMSSLSEQLQERAAERAASAQQASRAVASAATVRPLLDLSTAAAAKGLGASLCTALKDRRQLSVVSMWEEGHVGPVQQSHWLGVEEVPEHVRDPDEPSSSPVAWHQRQRSVVKVLPEEPLADALDKLRVDLERKQSSWPEFATDAERALENLSNTMSVLFQTDGLSIGTVELVLDEQYVLTRRESNRLLLVSVYDPERPWPVSRRLAEKAKEPDAPAILSHPLVVRHLDYQRRAAAEAQDLLERKRATRAMTGRSRPEA